MANYVKITEVMSKAFAEEAILKMRQKAQETMFVANCKTHGETTHVKGLGCLKCKEDIEAKEKFIENRWDFEPPFKYIKSNITQYIVETNQQQKAKQVFTALCSDFNKFNNAMTKGLNLWIYGNSGAGKTHLAIAFLNFCYSAKHLNVVYVNINEYLQLIKASYKNNDDNTQESKEKLMKRFIYADVLVIDELGMSDFSEHEHELFYQMIDERVAKKSHKITIYISNIHFNGWEDFVGHRILSRIQENHYKLEVLGNDRRNKEIGDDFFFEN